MGARVYGVGARVYGTLVIFSVSPSPFGLDFGTLDFGLGLDNLIGKPEPEFQVPSKEST